MARGRTPGRPMPMQRYHTRGLLAQRSAISVRRPIELSSEYKQHDQLSRYEGPGDNGWHAAADLDGEARNERDIKWCARPATMIPTCSLALACVSAGACSRNSEISVERDWWNEHRCIYKGPCTVHNRIAATLRSQLRSHHTKYCLASSKPEATEVNCTVPGTAVLWIVPSYTVRACATGWLLYRAQARRMIVSKGVISYNPPKYRNIVYDVVYLLPYY